MEQPDVVAGNFAPSFSLNFFSILVHISGSIRAITLIWASLKRSFPTAKVEYRLVKSDAVRSGRKAKVRQGRLRAVQESMAYLYETEHDDNMSKMMRDGNEKGTPNVSCT